MGLPRIYGVEILLILCIFLLRSLSASQAKGYISAVTRSDLEDCTSKCCKSHSTDHDGRVCRGIRTDSMASYERAQSSG